VLPPQRSTLAEIVRILETLGLRLSSVVVFPGRDGLTQAIVRTGTLDAASAIGALSAAGYAARLVSPDGSS
jgi:hypothetical protein